LASGGEGRTFFVTNADPFNFTAPNCIGQRVKRIADQTKNLPDSDLLECVDQNVCYRSGHIAVGVPGCCLRQVRLVR
jgi:hypothetical protein